MPVTCRYGLTRDRRCGQPATHYCAGLPYCTQHSTGPYACGSERLLRPDDQLDIEGEDP